MRRLIQVTDNKMYICTEAVGSIIFFMPVVTVTVTDNVIDFEVATKGYYQYPENLSAREKINFIVTGLTRAEDGVLTDMHRFVNAFFDKTQEKSSCTCIFSRDGSLPGANQLVNQMENQL